jgi:hypothetical protein
VLPLENFSGTPTYQFFIHGVVLDYDTSKLVNLIVSTGTAPVGGVPSHSSTSLSSLGNNLYVGNATLTELSQGDHNLTVWVSVHQYMMSYDFYVGAVVSTVSFNIDSIPQASPIKGRVYTYAVFLTQHREFFRRDVDRARNRVLLEM